MKEIHLLHGNRPFAICAAAEIGMKEEGTILLDEEIALRLHFPIRQIQYNRFALDCNKKTRSVGFTRATVQIIEGGKRGRSVSFAARIIRDLFQISGFEALADSAFMSKLVIKHEKKEAKEQEEMMKEAKEKEEMIKLKDAKEQEEMQEKVNSAALQHKENGPNISIKRTPWKIVKKVEEPTKKVPYMTKVVEIGGVLMAKDFDDSDGCASDATENDGSSLDDDSNDDSPDNYRSKSGEEDNASDHSGDYVFTDYDPDTRCIRERLAVDTGQAFELHNSNRTAGSRNTKVRKVRASNAKWWKQIRAGITKEDMEAESSRREQRSRTRGSDDLLDRCFPGGSKVAHGLVERWAKEEEERQRNKRRDKLESELLLFPSEF